MRIAQIAPVWVPVPPPSYGGIELVVGQLADGLTERGHDVTLFAAAGSKTKARLVSPVSGKRDLADADRAVTDELVHALPAYLGSDEFDVIHDHTGMGTALGAVRRGIPVIHTLHGPWNDASCRFYKAVSPPIQLIAISESQAAGNTEVSYAGVVHNGVDIDRYPWEKDKDDFVVFLGRCSPEKGPEIAVEVAKRAGLPLVMMVKRTERHEIEHWKREVEPRLTGDEDIRFDVGHEDKVDILARARATLFPIQWPEPFGLVMIESMACGTPVVGTPRGAAPEVIIEGKTGFLAEDIDGMVAALGRIDGLEPADCRQHVTDNFSSDAMVDKTERVLEQAVKDH